MHGWPSKSKYRPWPIQVQRDAAPTNTQTRRVFVRPPICAHSSVSSAPRHQSTDKPRRTIQTASAAGSGLLLGFMCFHVTASRRIRVSGWSSTALDLEHTHLDGVVKPFIHHFLQVLNLKCTPDIYIGSIFSPLYMSLCLFIGGSVGSHPLLISFRYFISLLRT